MFERHERVRAETKQLETQLSASGAEVQQMQARLAEIEGREEELIAREAELNRRESELKRVEGDSLRGRDLDEWTSRLEAREQALADRESAVNEEV